MTNLFLREYTTSDARVILEILGQKEHFKTHYRPPRYVILGSREYESVIAYDLGYAGADAGKDTIGHYNGLPATIFDLTIIVIPFDDHFYTLFSTYRRALAPNCPELMVLVLPDAHDAIELAWGKRT